jgi:hypothetical protein
MISALRKLDHSDAQQVLLAIVEDFLPTPQKRASLFDDPQRAAIRNEVLREVRRRLKLQPDDRSATANARILNFISDEIGGYTATPLLEDKIRARLGERGDLRPDQYEIRFSQQFNDLSVKRGIRWADAREALMHPDDVQHLTPKAAIFELGEAEEISLYAKTYGEPESAERRTMLVTARRHGYTLTATSAWSVYHSDVNVVNARTPLDVLQAFVETYGVPFRVGNSVPKKFYHYEVIPLADGQQGTDIFSLPPGAKQVEGEMVFRVTPLRVAEVRAAYTIDIPRYVADLQRHGVNARE